MDPPETPGSRRVHPRACRARIAASLSDSAATRSRISVAVAIELGRADPGDRGQVGQEPRPALGDRRQGRVVEDRRTAARRRPGRARAARRGAPRTAVDDRRRHGPLATRARRPGRATAVERTAGCGGPTLRAPDASRRRHDLEQEARAAPVGRPAVPAPGRRQPQVDPRPGDPDVQQPALLLDLGRLGRLADRQDPLLEGRQEDGVPLEALGPVVGQQLDAEAGRAVRLGGRPPVDLGRKSSASAAGSAVSSSRPTSSSASRAAWRWRASSPGGTSSARKSSARAQVAARSLGQAAAARSWRPPPAGPRSAADRRRRANGRDRPADLRSGEEPLAAELERDARRPERRLEPDELAVRPDEHGDLLGRHARAAMSRRASAAIARSSSRPVANWRMTGGGPSGRVGTSRFGGPATARGARARSRLASSRTWGVER